ncbi:Bardet-Biedl syndrome 12 protein [Lepisosteus oculatus]|uniref:Bardet-Biedl syndrome 12 protein n=1 Tax=Lepisosteus oculatus TaxID=7918 RepID=UPI0035F500E0
MEEVSYSVKTPVLGCKVLSKGRHIGLQQLRALAGTGITLLGPNKSYKFIEDQGNGECALACSAFRLLEHLDFTCAVGQLLNETVQAHQKVFKTGTGCLLFLAGVWSVAVLELLCTGIPITDIISAMSEGLDSCSEACMTCCVAIEDIFSVDDCELEKQINSLNDLQIAFPSNQYLVSSQQVFLNDSQNTAPASFSDTEVSSFTQDRHTKKLMTQDGKVPASLKRKIKLTHSRYFSPKEADSKEGSPQVQSRITNFTHLCSVLSHGCDYGMNLALEANRIQTESKGKKDSCPRTFDVSKLVTCVLPGVLEGQSCATSGFVTVVSVELASLIKDFKDQTVNVVLINGDLSEKYRHVGFSTHPNIRNVTENLDSLGHNLQDKWVNAALTCLLKLKVNLVLVTGVACARLTEVCLKCKILVVERVKHNILKDFSETTGALPVAYVTHVNEHCVGGGARVSLWRECSHSKVAKMATINITVSGTALVTVVITSPVNGKLQALEDQFWSSAYRLHHALQDGKLFPGAGAIELFCVQHLQKLITQDSERTSKEENKTAASSRLLHTAGTAVSYKGMVWQHMAEGWKEYVATVLYNTGVYASKLEACTVVNQALCQKNKRMSLAPNFSELLVVGNTASNGHSGVSRKKVSVYDNVTVKLEAWRKALDLVLLVLQTDTEIITGYSAEDRGEQENGLMVL